MVYSGACRRGKRGDGPRHPKREITKITFY